jgi:hypothetical protein
MVFKKPTALLLDGLPDLKNIFSEGKMESFCRYDVKLPCYFVVSNCPATFYTLNKCMYIYIYILIYVNLSFRNYDFLQKTLLTSFDQFILYF